MKRKLTVLLAGVLCSAFVLFAACSPMNEMKNAAEDVKNGVENGVEEPKEKANDVKKSVEDMGSGVKEGVKKATENVEMMTSNEDKNVDRTNFITEEMAKQVAVDKAKVNASDVTFTKTEFEKNDGEYVYEIEFYSGNTEYETEISASDGTVVSYDVDKHE